MDLPKVSKHDIKALTLIFSFFLISLAVTIFAWKITSDVVENESRQLFNNKVNIVNSWISERVNTNTILLYSMRGFFEGSNDVSREDWKTYIQKAEIIKRYPGMASLIFIQAVKDSEKESFLKSVKSDSAKYPYLADFSITPEEEKDIYYVVKYIEPTEGREASLGLDFGREEKRLSALHQAQASRNITSTGKITLSTTEKPGFGLLTAINKKGEPEELLGFVAMIFRENELFTAIFGKENPFPYLDVKVYDGDNPGDENLLYHHQPKLAIPEQSKLTDKRSIPFDGSGWTIKVEGSLLTQLSPAQRNLPNIVLYLGLGFSVLFLILFLKDLYLHYRKTHTKGELV